MTGTVRSSTGRTAESRTSAPSIAPRPSRAGTTKWTAGLYQRGISPTMAPRCRSWIEPAASSVCEVTGRSYVLQKQNAMPPARSPSSVEAGADRLADPRREGREQDENHQEGGEAQLPVRRAEHALLYHGALRRVDRLRTKAKSAAAIVAELDDSEVGLGRVDTVLVCVPPPDGPAIAAALRERGFAVSEAPLPILAARVLGEAPRVVLVDVDLPGAVEAVERLREAAALAELICVGDPLRAAELGVSRDDGRAFPRPSHRGPAEALDVDAIVLAVVALAEPAVDPRLRGPMHPGAAPTIPPARGDDREASVSEEPSVVDPLDVSALLAPFDEDEGGPGVAPIEISPELLQILAAAEQRMIGIAAAHPSSVPAPDGDADIHLPPDQLAALDEPLDPEEATGDGSAGGSTGSAKVGTDGAHTSAAGQGTGAEPGRWPATASGTTAEKGTGVDGARPSRPPANEPGSVPSAAREPTLPPPTIGVEGMPPSPAPSVPPAQPAELLRTEPPPRMPPPLPAAPVAPPPAPEPPSGLRLPAVLGEGDAIRAIAAAIAARASGSLALGTEAALRRVVLHEGDIVTAVSSAADETLLAFLAARGDLERDAAARLAGRLPAFGRHAGAALIAHGHLGQDDLWPVLRAHAEWIVGRALLCEEGTSELEPEPPGRLKAEPSVFGGATGAEVLLEAIRRAIPPEVARRRLGGPTARIAEGRRRQLLVECALRPDEEPVVRGAAGRSVGDLLAEAEPEIACVLYALVSLGVLEALAPTRPEGPAPRGVDPLDEEALRARVRARVALVEDGDYFALLGVARAPPATRSAAPTSIFGAPSSQGACSPRRRRTSPTTCGSWPRCSTRPTRSCASLTGASGTGARSRPARPRSAGPPFRATLRRPPWVTSSSPSTWTGRSCVATARSTPRTRRPSAGSSPRACP